MRTKILLCIIFIFSFNVKVKSQPKLLVLGDSHMVGQFGDWLHRGIHEWQKYDVFSVAIGGAGSRTFLQTLRNFCCGFMIRAEKPGEPLVNEFMKRESFTYIQTDTNILAQYHSNIDSVLSRFKPDEVIIALGSNMIDAHQDLVTRIHRYAPDSKIFWVGPYARKNMNYRIREIMEVCADPFNNCVFIHSDDLVGNANLESWHFEGKQARTWADSICVRLQKAMLISGKIDQGVKAMYMNPFLKITPFSALFSPVLNLPLGGLMNQQVFHRKDLAKAS